mgnify:CR=1 FL=1
MSEKKQRRQTDSDDGGGPSAPFWMVTYSDMVTLLLTFFVMLLAMANFEEVGRVDAVFESIRLALGVGGYNESLPGIQLNPNFNSDPQPEDNVEPIRTELQEALARHLSDDLVVLTQNRTEVRVLLDDRVLFKPGSAELHPTVYLLLADVGQALANAPVRVEVEGHTDESGDATANWTLSSLRAVAVVDALQKRGGLDGDQLEAKGLGQYSPTSIQSTDRWNRRVELVIQSDSTRAFEALHEVERIRMD